MNRWIGFGAAVVMSIGTATAQHAGHQMPQPSQTPSAEMVAACAEAQQHVSALADRASARLETARQSNSPQELRAAVADLQTTLVEIRERAAVCGALRPADPHAGHGADSAGSAVRPDTSATPPSRSIPSAR